MKGYKGFDKDLKCYGGYQYEIGRTETTYKAELCKAGFHFCERPLDVFDYFGPANSRYCEIEADDVSPETGGSDTKRVAKKLTVKGEIGIAGIVKAAVNIGIEEAKSKTTGDHAHAATTGDHAHAATTGDGAHAAATGDCAHAAATGFKAHAAATGDWAHAATTGDWAHAATTGDWAHAATTGDWAHAATTGDHAHAATTGDWAHAAATGDHAHAATTGFKAHAEVSGNESIASALGIEGKAKGALGCWIVCAEWENKNGCWHIKCVKAGAVDGENIKADTWYMLKDGEFVEADDED